MIDKYEGMEVRSKNLSVLAHDLGGYLYFDRIYRYCFPKQ